MVLAAAVLTAFVPGCSREASGRTIVASFYPLAYLAERVAGPEWVVLDLTPPGTEAHDLELSLEDRAAIEDADIVLYMGNIGFQPQVEAAVSEANGEVVAVSDGLLFPKSDLVDPHVWLSLQKYYAMVAGFYEVMSPGPHEDDALDHRTVALERDVLRLDRTYRRSLENCLYRTMIVSHEAFGWMAKRYGLEQFGLSGITPEGEPTSNRILEAERLIEDGEAGAVFYESTEEGLRVAESLAGDAGVPALPLSTLESQPPEGDYLSVMEDNLESLREGLRCR